MRILKGIVDAKTVRNVVYWGALWGAFEATAGFALHLLPVNIGAYIWFPAAYFFMDRAYRATGKREAVVAAALLCAGIKLLNLATSVRVDIVVNPAISIALESLAMAAVLSIRREKTAVLGRAAPVARVFFVNTIWRLLFLAYIGLLAPAWMREGSMVSSAAAAVDFLVVQNIVTSGIGYLAVHMLVRRNSPAPFSLNNERSGYQ